MTAIQIHNEVQTAIDEGRPVVALESTVFSTLGLPVPHNEQALSAAHEVVRSGGAVPAMTAVIDGVAMVGVADEHWPRILTATSKVAERDLAISIATGLGVGVTTVSASVALAAAAGVGVFATGGIGGVHRESHLTGDVSADLGAIARHPVVTVSPGAKSFLDLPQTIERLETLSVPVIGFGTDRLPAFTALDSGVDLLVSMDDPVLIAEVARSRRALGQGGMLVAVPPPSPIDTAESDRVTAAAEAAADEAGVSGPARTPWILGHIAELTEGRSVAANIDLVANNARVATQIAAAL